MFAVDISRSMLAEDTRPSRLQRAVREARRLVQDLGQDRLGLIAFAGESYILTPLTLDGGAITLFLDALDPDMASQGGTGLASALLQGMRAAQRLPGGGRPGAGGVHRRRNPRLAARSAGGRARTAGPGDPAGAGGRGWREAGADPDPGQRGHAARVQDRRSRRTRSRRPAGTRCCSRSPMPPRAPWCRRSCPIRRGRSGSCSRRSSGRRTSSSSTQDLLPLVWIPALLAAALLGAADGDAPDGRAGGAGRDAAVLRRPRRSVPPRECASTRRGMARRRRGGSAARLSPTASDTPGTTPGPRCSARATRRRARSAGRRPPGRWTPISATGRCTTRAWPLLRRAAADSAAAGFAAGRGRGPPAERPEPGARPARAPSGISSWPSGVGSHHRRAAAASHRAAAARRAAPENQDPAAGGGRPPRACRASPEQAEQILNSVTREERETRAGGSGRARAGAEGRRTGDRARRPPALCCRRSAGRR